IGTKACACAESPSATLVMTRLKSRSAASRGVIEPRSTAAGPETAGGTAAPGAGPPGRTMDTPMYTMSPKSVIPAIHHGRFAPPTVAAAAARWAPPLSEAFAPHWLQKDAPGLNLPPHWSQKRPPSLAPQLWQKLPVAGLLHWGQKGPEGLAFMRSGSRSIVGSAPMRGVQPCRTRPEMVPRLRRTGNGSMAARGCAPRAAGARSQPRGLIDEGPREAEPVREVGGERPHTERLRGVVASEEHVDAALHRLEVRVVGTLPRDERIQPEIGGLAHERGAAPRHHADAPDLVPTTRDHVDVPADRASHPRRQLADVDGGIDLAPPPDVDVLECPEASGRLHADRAGQERAVPHLGVGIERQVAAVERDPPLDQEPHPREM